jgi:hypothetical protein
MAWRAEKSRSFPGGTWTQRDGESQFIGFGRSHMEVSYNKGTPKWIMYLENPIKLDDLGVPVF